MTIKRYTGITALLLLVSTNANAQFMTGNVLLNNIQSSTHVPQAVALGYVQGVYDALLGVAICPPLGLTAGQITDIVRKDLVDNPAIRHKAADVIIGTLFMDLWPCKDKKKGTGI